MVDTIVEKLYNVLAEVDRLLQYLKYSIEDYSEDEKNM